MTRFVARRIAQAVLVLLVATLAIFLATFALGDPFASTGEKVVPPEVQAIDRAKFGLDKPLPVQYLTYLGNLVHLDFGVDFNQRRQVSSMLAETLPNTIRLALVAIALDVLIGVIAGVIAAVKRYSFTDVLVTVSSTLAIGVPTFVIGLVLVGYVSGFWIFPVVPRSFTVQVPWWHEVLLPAFTLAIIDAAFIARLMRGSMLEVLRSDYIRTARSKGLPERVVTVSSLSKSHSMPGWRAGWLVGPRELATHAESLAMCMLFGLPGFIQEAAITALSIAPEAERRIRDFCNARRERFLAGLAAVPGIRASAPQAGMFMMVDVSATGLSGYDFMRALYERERVSVLDGGAFGRATARFIRVCFATDEATIDAACARIRRFCELEVSSARTRHGAS